MNAYRSRDERELNDEHGTPWRGEPEPGNLGVVEALCLGRSGPRRHDAIVWSEGWGCNVCGGIR